MLHYLLQLHLNLVLGIEVVLSLLLRGVGEGSAAKERLRFLPGAPDTQISGFEIIVGFEGTPL